MKNLGNVYFIGAGRFVKIGFAHDVAKRLVELQTGNPMPLVLLAVIPNCAPSVERMYHKAFAGARIRGEWFSRRALGWVLTQVQCGAAPRSLAAIEYYVNLPGPRSLNAQNGLNRACEELRKAVKSGIDWSTQRSEWIARGPEYKAAVALMEQRLTKRRRLKYGAPVIN
jgi:hypothetical protein